MTLLIVLAVVAFVAAFVLALFDSALSRVSRVTAVKLREEGRQGAASLAKVLQDPPPHLSVLAFGRIVAEAVVAVVIALTVNNLVASDLQAFGIAVTLMAVIGFVFVGVSPRTLGRQHAARVALVAAPVAVWLRRVLGPISRLLVLVANVVTPGRGYRDGPFQSEAELRDLLDLASESAVIEDEERAMLHSVFEFGDTFAREVMVPRTDMVTIEADRGSDKGLRLFLRSGFSRMPVIGEDADDVLGLLYFKDVVRHITDDGDPARPVRDLMRPVPFVPESKPVADLLHEMQQDQTHLVVVVDEYGGTAGLVTIEDLLEEIVGEIADEYDNEDPEVEDLGDGRWRVEAGMDIDDLAEMFDVEIEDDEVDTVAGLLAKLEGRVPIVGTTATIAGLRLTADRLAGRRHRLASVVVERLPGPPEQDGRHD